MARLKNRYMSAPAKLTATEEYEAKQRVNLKPISKEEAYQDNPALRDMGEGDENTYYRNQFGHVVSKDPLSDPSDPGIITTELSEAERERSYGDASATDNASGQRFWSIKMEGKKTGAKPEPKVEVDLGEAQIVKMPGKSGKYHAFSQDNPHTSDKMSKKELDFARKWERENDTQFRRSGSNRFGGGSGNTSTEQENLRAAYLGLDQRNVGEKPPSKMISNFGKPMQFRKRK